MAEDNCALNHDGSLKDASEIQWHYDPDDAMPLPKNNKRARIEKMFLDIEVKVASDSEGEEDDEDMDGFINDEDEDEDDPNTPIPRLTLQCSLYARLQNEDKKQQVMDCICSGGGDLFASLQAGKRIDNHRELINNIVTMYVNSGSSSYIGAVLPASGTSSSADWALWDLTVKDGFEEDVVFSLSLHGGSKYIHSAFSLLVIPGHVYVEARCLDDLKTSTKILADVYQNSICLAPTASWDESFSKIGECYTPSKNTWVRLKGRFQYDLGFIRDVCERSFKIKVVHIPRIMYRNSSKRKHASKTSPKTFEVVFEDHNNVIIKGYNFRKSFYTPEGFILHKNVTSECHYEAEATPTIEELRSFESCIQIPKNILEDTRRAVLSAAICIRDQVKVVLQQPKVLLAFVEDISEGNTTLRLLESPTILFEYPVIQLQKCFKIGDGIRVKSGHLKGIVGMVSYIQPYGQIGEEKVTIVTFPIKGHHESVRSSDLDFCSEVHRSHTFKVESKADREYEARIMQEDPYKFLYGQYAVVKFGRRKGDMGILKSVNADGKAILEVQARLISSYCQDKVSINDLYIPGHYDTLPEIFKGLNSVGNSSSSMNICPTPQRENDFGTGSHTPAWNSSSRTPQVSNTAAAEFIAYPHRIPENQESTGHLEPSGFLPPSMQTFVGFPRKERSSGYGRESPKPPNLQGEYQVVNLKGEVVFAYPLKGKKRHDRGIDIPIGDLAVIAERC
ncbi:hypothetical protein BDQ17DRAFT_1428649 [Cyathus striatus]|nr:hypothetical protein BDQ17DRAFT_1428649 [Cyathus striatus]